MNKSVSMNSDINKSSGNRLRCGQFLRDHTLFQILDIGTSVRRIGFGISSRGSCRFLQLFYNIPKSDLSNFQFISSLLVIPICLESPASALPAISSAEYPAVSQEAWKPPHSSRVNACRVKRIGAACNTRMKPAHCRMLSVQASQPSEDLFGL